LVEAYLEVLEEGFYEIKFAFDGLADDHVWKRPAAGLLSVGELAGHISFWEAVKFAGEGGDPLPDPAKCKISSLLVDPRFSYYPTTLATPPSPEHLAMTAEQVCSEVLRVHNEAFANFKALNPDLDSRPPGWRQSYRVYLKYAAFHVAYHTGQIYSVRHLLGEQTPDN
jgi:hypothetical protein